MLKIFLLVATPDVHFPQHACTLGCINVYFFSAHVENYVMKYADFKNVVYCYSKIPQ